MRKNKDTLACLPCTVIRDGREKSGHGWIFPPTQYCAGTVSGQLKTGDYTLKGFEKYLTIERKETVLEFVGSMVSANFKKELERMQEITHPIVVLEFEFAALSYWPMSSGIRLESFRRRLPLQYVGAAVAKFTELQLDYPHVQFVFAGQKGMQYAGNTFKRIIEKYAKFVVKRQD